MKLVSIILLVIFCPKLCLGQDNSLSADSDPKRIYEKAELNFFTICNGPIYKDANGSVGGNPFFGSEDFEEGEVVYSGRSLKCVLQYDIFSKKVVTDCSGKLVELVEENLDEFSFLGRKFKKLDTDSNALISKGFYEVLYEGEIKFYAKRQKFINEEIVGYTLKKDFVELDKYYVCVNGKYYSIKNKSGLLSVLASKKKLMQKKIKSERLEFKKNWEKSVQLLCAYYDQKE